MVIVAAMNVVASMQNNRRNLVTDQDSRPYNDDRLRLARKMRIANTHGWDPWVDANDDYAVLEWMRTTDDKRFSLGHGPYGYQCIYQIGDYARAALKVLAYTGQKT